MITLPTSSVQPSVTYDTVWIKDTHVIASDPTRPTRVVFQVSPQNSVSGTLAPFWRTIVINDMFATASYDTNVALIMSASFNYVQSQVISQSLFQ